MPIRFKTGAGGAGNPYGGSWVGPIADGNLRVKWGGSSWTNPAYCRVKSGAVGGGSWVDSGYRGYPLAPAGFHISSWTYSTVSTAWSHPGAGGAPIQDYQIVQTNEGGGWIAEYHQGHGTRDFGVAQDTRYQFYVRSRSTSGLYSAFVGPIRVQIGHGATNNYGYVQRTRGWESERTSGWRNKDDPWWVGVPGSVYITGLHIRNLYAPQSSVVSGGTNRTINSIFNGGDFGSIGTAYNGHNIDQPLGNWGGGGAWGWVPRGAGWSTTGNTTFMCHCDAQWASGTEYYDNYEVVSTNPAVGNSYW